MSASREESRVLVTVCLIVAVTTLVAAGAAAVWPWIGGGS